MKYATIINKNILINKTFSKSIIYEYNDSLRLSGFIYWNEACLISFYDIINKNFVIKIAVPINNNVCRDSIVSPLFTFDVATHDIVKILEKFKLFDNVNNIIHFIYMCVNNLGQLIKIDISVELSRCGTTSFYYVKKEKISNIVIDILSSEDSFDDKSELKFLYKFNYNTETSSLPEFVYLSKNKLGYSINNGSVVGKEIDLTTLSTVEFNTLPIITDDLITNYKTNIPLLCDEIDSFNFGLYKFSIDDNIISFKRVFVNEVKSLYLYNSKSYYINSNNQLVISGTISKDNTVVSSEIKYELNSINNTNENSDLHTLDYDAYIHFGTSSIIDNKYTIGIKSYAPSMHKGVPNSFFIKRVDDLRLDNRLKTSLLTDSNTNSIELFNLSDENKLLKMFAEENDKIFSDNGYKKLLQLIGNKSVLDITDYEEAVCKDLLFTKFFDSRFIQKYGNYYNNPTEYKNSIMYASVGSPSGIKNEILKYINDTNREIYKNTPIYASRNKRKFDDNPSFYIRQFNHQAINTNYINSIILPFVDISFRGFDNFNIQSGELNILLPLYYNYLIFTKKDKLLSKRYNTLSYGDQYVNSLIRNIFKNIGQKESTYLSYNQIAYLISDKLIDDFSLRNNVDGDIMNIDEGYAPNNIIKPFNSIYERNSSFNSYILK